MKKVFRNGVTLVVLLTTIMNFTAEAVNAAAFKYESNAEFTSSKIEAGDKVVVKNRRGWVLMDAVASSALYYEQLLELSSLPDGSYTLEVTKDIRINIVPFSVTSGDVSMAYNLEYTLFKPTIRHKGELLYISQLSLEKEPLEIELYFNPDNDGGYSFQLIHAEKVENTIKIGRIYELNKKEKGVYRLVLTYGGRTYTEKFKL